MTVGEMILETRKNSGFTQEEYGEKFGVTRQTVSSWENGRSYPDLQVLIAICDTFDMSLDKLLREDRKMVGEVDKNTWIANVLHICVRIVAVVIAIFLVYCSIWYVRKNQEEKEFLASMKEAGFQFEDGRYVAQRDGIKYKVPNQKLPFLKFHYYAMQVEPHYDLGKGMSLHLWIFEDRIEVEINGNPELGFGITEHGELKDRKELSDFELEIYEEYKDKIVQMAEEGVEIFSEIYK